MAAGNTVNYNTEKLLAGNCWTATIKLPAGTYYRGQLLNVAYTDGAVTAGTSFPTDGASRAVIYLGPAETVGDSKTYSVATYDSVIVGGEVYAGGVVGSNGAAIAFTDLTYIAALASNFNVRKV